ncbi:hypothetical protein BDY21DRAFT_373789 [Lineolata rhizophorae]|uniref:Rhodopsin domain-containing protein n=1 Tax=Lineolata rhizophorae TaxID=578093 RepID=A0A6A6NSZ2_9PEZI|nr:hypothetical protein BDY21DRAFT_373789 [Lineolata rhizophorae]
MSSQAPPPPPESYSEDKGAHVTAVVITFAVLSFIFVSLRLYTRLRIVKNVGPEDIFIALAWVFSVGVSACMCMQVRFGTGRHVWTLTDEDMMHSLQALYASIIVYNFGLTFTKLSILIQFLRIFVTKSVRRACFVMIGVVVVYGFWTVLSAILNCIPVDLFWDKSLDGHCIHQQALWFVNAAINIATDFAIIVLPIPALKCLMLPRRQKIILMFIFALGGFACITSILRLHALYVVSVSDDITWDNPGSAIWSSVELNTGIICACLPTLRALVARVFPRFFPAYRYTAGSGANGGTAGGHNRTGRSGGTAGTVGTATLNTRFSDATKGGDSTLLGDSPDRYSMAKDAEFGLSLTHSDEENGPGATTQPPASRVRESASQGSMAAAAAAAAGVDAHSPLEKDGAVPLAAVHPDDRALARHSGAPVGVATTASSSPPPAAKKHTFGNAFYAASASPHHHHGGGDGGDGGGAAAADQGRKSPELENGQIRVVTVVQQSAEKNEGAKAGREGGAQGPGAFSNKGLFGLPPVSEAPNA